MDTTEFLQALTLWFVVLVFLRTGSGDGGPAVAAISLLAVILLFAIPLYLLLVFVSDVRGD